MSKNDVTLLTNRMNEWRSQSANLRASEQEAYFCARHLLKEHDPTHDDLISGVVDGEHDGGVDGAYILVNGLIIRDDTPTRSMGVGARVELHLLQVKNTTGFKEDAVDKVALNLPQLLEFGRDEQHLSKMFNSRIREVTGRFMKIIQEISSPELSITVTFASLKAEHGPHQNVIERGNLLKQAIRDCFGTAKYSVEFRDASSLLEISRQRAPFAKTLRLAENPLTTNTEGGYIGVVSLAEYYDFITTTEGQLDTAVFEANVRDYEDDSAVNRSIQATLKENVASMDFWWLNNGVTIVTDRIEPMGKSLKLTSPQVVNGLQTSHEIFKYGSEGGPLHGDRSILVKMIATAGEETKDRIIRATNSQTSLGPSSLRATDAVQRNIEEYFVGHSLYYERRKNYYKNNDISLRQLVSIDQLGQAVISVFAQFPHVARGQASRIFDNSIYELVFSESYPLSSYFQTIMIVRSCEEFLRTNPRTREEVQNFLFHLTMLTSIALTRKNQPRPEDIGKISARPSNELLRTLLPIVQESFADTSRRKNHVLFDQVSKDEESTKHLLEAASRYLASTRRSPTSGPDRS